jgi:hypothetical protein
VFGTKLYHLISARFALFNNNHKRCFIAALEIRWADSLIFEMVCSITYTEGQWVFLVRFNRLIICLKGRDLIMLTYVRMILILSA